MNCKKCGKELIGSGIPVTKSGWYGDILYVWRMDQIVQINDLCYACSNKTEME